MKTLICGKTDECFVIDKYKKDLYAEDKTLFCEGSEKLLNLLVQHRFDMAVVLFDGANGMETVMTLKRQCPELPVIWLSDDGGFAAQSYRLGCAYFSEKRFIGKNLASAISRCHAAAV